MLVGLLFGVGMTIAAGCANWTLGCLGASPRLPRHNAGDNFSPRQLQQARIVQLRLLHHGMDVRRGRCNRGLQTAQATALQLHQFRVDQGNTRAGQAQRECSPLTEKAFQRRAIDTGHFEGASHYFTLGQRAPAGQFALRTARQNGPLKHTG